MLYKKSKLIFILQKSYLISENWSRKYLLILTKINSIFPMHYNVSLYLERKNVDYRDDTNRCELIVQLTHFASTFHIAFDHTYLTICT